MCLLAAARACGDEDTAGRACQQGITAAVMRYAKACQPPVHPEATMGGPLPAQGGGDSRGRRMSQEASGMQDDDSSSVASGIRGGNQSAYAGDPLAPRGTPEHARFYLRGEKMRDPKAYEEYVGALFPADLDERAVLAANVLYNLSCHDSTKRYLIRGAGDVRLPKARAPATGEQRGGKGSRSKPLDGDALKSEAGDAGEQTGRRDSGASISKVPFAKDGKERQAEKPARKSSAGDVEDEA